VAGGNGQGRDVAFYARVLAGIGAPINQINLGVLAAWQKAEGGSSSWNPFNTTQSAPGAKSYNSVGVRNYPDETTGVNATVATLQNGYYKPILSALKASNPDAAIAAIVSSPWDGGYGAPVLSGGKRDYTRSSIYSAWSSHPANGVDSIDVLPNGLTSGTGSLGTAQLDTYNGTLIDPGGTIWASSPNAQGWQLWLRQTPVATIAGTRIVAVPGAYAAAAKTKDPGAVQEITPGTVVGDTATSITNGLAPLGAAFGWLNDNKGRIGLALVGVFVLIFGLIYTQKGTITESAKTAAKLAAVA
jgi:hypothetical protein